MRIGVTNSQIVDTTPTNGSSNPVSSDGVYDALENKANDTDVVKLTGNQVIDGIKTFKKNITTRSANAIGTNDYPTTIELDDKNGNFLFSLRCNTDSNGKVTPYITSRNADGTTRDITMVDGTVGDDTHPVKIVNGVATPVSNGLLRRKASNGNIYGVVVFGTNSYNGVYKSSMLPIPGANEVTLTLFGCSVYGIVTPPLSDFFIEKNQYGCWICSTNSAVSGRTCDPSIAISNGV